jgi:hypothetical protein
MAEHDYVIANQNGANTRSDLNNALAAIVSNNSKATAPTTTYAFMWWADTANDILKQRNAADSAWISILTLSTGAPLADYADNALSGNAIDGGTISNFTSTGIDDNATSTALEITTDGRGLSQFTAKAWVRFNGTGTVAIIDSHNISSITDNTTGQTTCSFSNNLANVNYAITTGNDNGEYSSFFNAGTQAHQFQIRTYYADSNSYVDTANNTAIVFGD